MVSRPTLFARFFSFSIQILSYHIFLLGDGVNDVAAIESADVAASLLTGFGAENSESSVDVDDKRRMKKLTAMNIGSNRAENVGKARKQEANERIRREIEKCREDIDNGASLRDNEGSESSENEYKFDDVKQIISATMRAAKNERRRAEQLRKGGGDAARILAEERQEQISTENDEDNTDVLSPPTIKPGEASLVSSFSCLHPSVDGVEAILREGIATAASALATQQEIGLHSLMSCFHLATLYRDGFRYGKHMWNVEVFFYQLSESARYKASCTPRPRLPNSVFDRPPTSMFQFVSIFGTVSQAIIHISCMALSVRYAKHLENYTKVNIGEERIRLNHLYSPEGKKLGKLMDTLSKRSLLDTSTMEGEKNSNPFFQRSPFRPNYETNIVFIFSILQSAISALVNHKGNPFYHSILESRNLCAMSGITLLFAIVCITGKMSTITNFLEVKPLPSRHSKLVFLGITVINIVACLFCRYVMDNFLSNVKSSGVETITPATEIELKNAADHEEKLLLEETKQNLKGLRLFCGVVFYFMLDVIISSR